MNYLKKLCLITAIVGLLHTVVDAQTKVQIKDAGKLGHNVDIYYQFNNLSDKPFKMLSPELIEKHVDGVRSSESYTKYGYVVEGHRVVDTNYIKANYGEGVAKFVTNYTRLDIRNKAGRSGWVVYQMVNDVDNPENNRYLIITIRN